MDVSRARERLAGFLTYILGRNPYEFGLVPDENGFIKIKDVLKVLAEEKGWEHVRKESIDELIIALPDPGIELLDGQIRAINRETLSKPVVTETLPRLFYIGIRKKAHVHVVEKGILPHDNLPFLVLSSDKDMAERIARRKDPEPVILTINTREAENQGVLFLHAGEELYVARHIPLKCFTGPPIPQAGEERSWSGKKKKPERKSPPTPGTYVPDFGEKSRVKNMKNGREDRESWKHNKKKIRKQKEKFREDV